MRTMLALFVVLAVASAAAPVTAESASADLSVPDVSPGYDLDLGQKWSMKVQFVFAGKDAASVEWDFGDGSTSTEWNPLHEYPEEGVYYGSQTVRNGFDPDGSGEGSADVLRFRVEVMGYPEITFDSAGGSSVERMCQTSFAAVAERPSDPVYEGHDFTGWYLDGEPYDWSQPVKKDMTLTAGWDVQTHHVVFVDAGGNTVSDQNVVHGGMPDMTQVERADEDCSVVPEVKPATGDATYTVTYSQPASDAGSGESGLDVLPFILIGVGAVLAVIGARRGVPAVMPGVAVAVVGALEASSVIDLLPELML